MNQSTTKWMAKDGMLLKSVLWGIQILDPNL